MVILSSQLNIWFPIHALVILKYFQYDWQKTFSAFINWKNIMKNTVKIFVHYVLWIGVQKKKSAFLYCNELFLFPPPHSIMSRICKATVDHFCHSPFPLYTPTGLKHSHPTKPGTFLFKGRTKKLNIAILFTWHTYYSHSSSFVSHEIILHILFPHYFFVLIVYF